MSNIKGSFGFHSADIGGKDRRGRVDPRKLLDMIARMKAASSTAVSAPQQPAQTKTG